MRNRSTNRGPRRAFASNNSLGIPDLLPDMLATELVGNLVPYRAGRHQQKSDTLCFFVDDYRFEVAWSYPHRMLNALHGWQAVCEPDFSLWTDRPIVEQQWNLYRNRWCARFWQEHGIKVIPVLNWSTPQSYEWAWLGLPSIKLAAVECQTCDRRTFNHGLAAACEATGVERVIVYGCWQGVIAPRGVELIRQESRVRVLHG